ncbi:WYL domain-containing protein [Thermomonospora umbrina]|uniref:HTH domain-containing protein n=1 Tax=Thermomonospora umbrina TaxID=111806 RepID=A0A3D9T0R3_9ACTN|nr:WYL domain-containing protein [Thermomonospora umbrina]REF00401.1 HTH domain-containing protein [Thermomonospora umbrina]
MTRADRLLALVAELRGASPAPVPAAELARRLAVSQSTVRRDLGMLARAGLPLLVERGRGYSVRTPTAPSVSTEASSLVAPVRDTLTEAVRGRRVVRLDYTGASGARTRRDVEAHGLVTAPYGEYLMGWCRTREGPRLFRVDRVGAAYLTGRTAAPREPHELPALLRVPLPRRPADEPAPAGTRRGGTAAAGRAWTLGRLREVSGRLTDLLAALRSGGEGTAAARAVLGHLAEWTRWQVAAVRAVATGADLEFDGDRPPFPDAFDDDVPFPARERMIQDAMAPRSLAEIARDLHMILHAASRWAGRCDAALWRGALPDPAAAPATRPLADLLAGRGGPLAHIEWHLDRLPGGPHARDARPSAQVTDCPLHR